MTSGKKIPGPGAFAFKMLLQNGNRLFGYELIYFFVVFIMMNPVLNAGIRWAMKEAGYSYLTSENLLRFLSKPATLAVLLGITLVGGLFLLFGMSILMAQLLSARRGQRKGFLSALGSAAKRVWVVILPKNMLLPVAAILMACFFNLVFLAGIGSQIRIPRYFLQSLIKREYLKPVLIAAAVLLLVISFLMLFMLPYCMLEHKSFREGAGSSCSLIKRKWIRSAGLFLLWNVCIGVAVAAVYALSIVASAFFIKVFVREYMESAVFLMTYEHINFFVSCFAALLGIVANTSLVTCLYFYYKWEEKEKYQKILEPPLVLHMEKKLSKTLTLAMIIALISVDVLYIYDLVRNGNSFFNENLEYIEITSHRGCSYRAPENTIPAIEMAIENLADYVEVDVRKTKDGVLVLFHDSDLYRITGTKGAVEDFTYEQLQKLDAGLWFGESYRGTRIPALEEALALCKGRVNLNIEVKVGSDMALLDDKLLELIKKYSFEHQCVVTSTKYEVLENIKEKKPEIKTGYILTGGYGDFYKNREAADFFSMKSIFVSERLVRALHEQGKAIHVWTVNSDAEIERMKQLEVDNIITDKPIEARELIYSKENSKTFIGLLNMVD